MNVPWDNGTLLEKQLSLSPRMGLLFWGCVGCCLLFDHRALEPSQWELLVRIGNGGGFAQDTFIPLPDHTDGEAAWHGRVFAMGLAGIEISSFSGMNPDSTQGRGAGGGRPTTVWAWRMSGTRLITGPLILL